MWVKKLVEECLIKFRIGNINIDIEVLQGGSPSELGLRCNFNSQNQFVKLGLSKLQ